MADFRAICAKCQKSMGGSQYVYHCPKGKSKHHPDKKYFTICGSCGEKHRQGVRQHQQENKQENKEHHNNNNLESEGNILFNNLVAMADERLLTQKQQFKQIVDGISSTTSWKDMIVFPRTSAGSNDLSQLKKLIHPI